MHRDLKCAPFSECLPGLLCACMVTFACDLQQPPPVLASLVYAFAECTAAAAELPCLVCRSPNVLLSRCAVACRSLPAAGRPRAAVIQPAAVLPSAAVVYSAMHSSVRVLLCYTETEAWCDTCAAGQGGCGQDLRPGPHESAGKPLPFFCSKLATVLRSQATCLFRSCSSQAGLSLLLLAAQASCGVQEAGVQATAQSSWSPLWAAPEVVRLERGTIAADVWSLGIIVWVRGPGPAVSG